MKYAAVISVVTLIIIIFAYNTVFAPPNDGAVVSEMNNKITQEGEVEEVKADKFTGTGTLASLKQFSQSVECTITYQPNEVESAITGTYFVNDGRMRGDFLVMSPDLQSEILSSVIVDDNYFYSWSEIDGQSYGVKMRVDELAAGDFEGNEPVSLDSEVSYTCKPWLAVDNSVFNPPTKVLFRDMNNLVPPGMEYGTVYEEDVQMELP